MQDARSRPTVTCMSRRLALAVLPLVLLVAPLAACTESARIPPPEPSATVEPLFASDEEALAAATEAYEEYLAVLDVALQQPANVDASFTEVAVGPALDEAVESMSTFVDQGLRIVGMREVTAAQFQQSIVSDDQVALQIYVCESVANVDILNSDGVSLVQPERPDLTAFEVTLVADEQQILVEQRIVWEGGGVCEAQ